MKINFIIFLITAFLIGNTYYDGKFTEFLLKGKNSPNKKILHVFQVN